MLETTKCFLFESFEATSLSLFFTQVFGSHDISTGCSPLALAFNVRGERCRASTHNSFPLRGLARYPPHSLHVPGPSHSASLFRWLLLSSCIILRPHIHVPPCESHANRHPSVPLLFHRGHAPYLPSAPGTQGEPVPMGTENPRTPESKGHSFRAEKAS